MGEEAERARVHLFMATDPATTMHKDNGRACWNVGMREDLIQGFGGVGSVAVVSNLAGRFGIGDKEKHKASESQRPARDYQRKALSEGKGGGRRQLRVHNGIQGPISKIEQNSIDFVS
jgi:hypothetical protein